jgi:hypothetical protein
MAADIQQRQTIADIKNDVVTAIDEIEEAEKGGSSV